jgi:putative transposase
LLRQIELAIASGLSVPMACIDAGIAEATYYRWCAEFGRPKMHQIEYLEKVERENENLRQLLANYRDVPVDISVFERRVGGIAPL